MKTILHEKLIRDKIPEIIEASGKTPVVETLSSPDYIKMLNEKLQEEVSEYLDSESVEELADIVEVLLAILAYKSVSKEEFEKIRTDKRQKRGGFEKRLLLVEVQEED